MSSNFDFIRAAWPKLFDECVRAERYVGTPVVLGGGKRLFDDFDEPVSLEHLGLLQSPFATHITYRVTR